MWKSIVRNIWGKSKRRLLAAVLVLSLASAPAKWVKAAPQTQQEKIRTVQFEDVPSPSDADSGSGSIADSDIAVTNEMIVVYDDAGVSEAKSEKIQEKAEEALDDLDAEITEKVSEAGGQQGTVVVAELPKETKVEEAIEQIESDKNVSFAQPNFVYRALGDALPEEVMPEETLSKGEETAAPEQENQDAASFESGTGPETEEDRQDSGEQEGESTKALEPDKEEAPLPKEEDASSDGIAEKALEPAAVDPADAELEEERITNDKVYNNNCQKYSNYLRDTDAYGAWDTIRANKTVTVAVFDSGCRLDHEDLQNNILKNYAYDSYYNRPLTASSAPNGGDSTGHGTLVCGLIAAEANNGIGVAGTSYNAGLLPVKIFDNDGAGATTATLMRGIEYCRQLIEDGKVRNLKVMNMSVGYYSDGTKESVDILLENMIGIMADYYDVLCVCSGGNGDESTTPYVRPMYPSDFENCLSVTSLDMTGKDSVWSDYNPSKDISAPGEKIISTDYRSRNTYAETAGTSMAAPIVSGICSLLWAYNPNLTVDEAVEAVEVTADDIPDVDIDRKDNSGSHGAINAKKAIAHIANRNPLRGSIDISGAAVSGIGASYEYTGGKIRPNITVSVSGVKLKKNSDYTVSYGSNINVSTAERKATVTIEGIGKYKGTVVKSFHITPKNIAKCAASLPGTTYVYTGSAVNPPVTVRVSSQNSVKLRNGVDYTVSYSNNVEPGTASVTIRAKGNNYTGSIVKNYTITKADISTLASSLSRSAYTYNKKAKKPSVTVKYGAITLAGGRDYTVSYSKNVKVGQASVKITGRGSHYTGTITKTFKINPKGTKLSKLTKKSKGFQVKWKKQATQTTGYQIQYSTSKKFNKAKTKTIKKTKTTSASIFKLKKKKAYYVRIRTYKKIGSKKYYSGWSKAKKVKTR